MVSIPNFTPDDEYTFDVEIGALVKVIFHNEPTVQELKEALFEGFVEYVNYVLEHDKADFAKTWVKAEFVDKHTFF